MACASCSRPLPEGAKFCPFCGHEVVTTASEERRLVTVLFADIVGYTGMVEHLDPERVKRVIDGAFELLIADIVEYGGSIDKLLGDGILALFGAPVTHEDDPDRAIRAALKMHDSLAAFVAEHDEIRRDVQLRVGVNTGEVVVGRVGGTDDYTAMGDVVNVASRLQTMAPPGGIYIGDSTASLASSEILREIVDDVDLRGREQTELVWRVTGRRTGFVEPRRAERTPFVGRADQRACLEEVLHELHDGSGAVVAISGEAGAGKTRLVSEVLADFTETGDGEAIVLAGACVPYGENNVWSPISTAMFGRLDAETTTSPERLRDLTAQRASDVYGIGVEEPVMSWLAEAVLHISGHPSAFDEVPPAQARETLFRLVVEVLRRRSSLGPVVLWIDDLQWADALIVDLLHRVARSLEDRPVLVITAQRTDADIDWPDIDDPDVVSMALEPLTRDEAEHLIEQVTDGAANPVRVRELYERSGGNPLFLSQLAELAGGSDEAVELPSSLRVLIAAQLDRLPPTARAIIDNAAILGVDGPVASLRMFADELHQPYSEEDLDTLQANGLLDIDRGWYRFRSDVVREVAYQTLTKLVRAERHAATAAVMLTLPGIPVDRVAHHAATAAELIADIGPVSGVPETVAEQAVELLHRAADRALEVGAFAQTLKHACRALDLAPEDPGEIRALRLLCAYAATERRDIDIAREHALAALESALEAGDRFDEGIARRLLGTVSQYVGDINGARQELGESVEIFRQLGDESELATSLADRGFVEVFGGSLADAEWLLSEAEALAERLGDRRSLAWVREHQAWVAFLSGDVALAEDRLETAASEFEELQDRAGRSWAQSLRAYLHFFERQFDEAEELADQVRLEAIELGERWAPAMMDSLVAAIRLWTGRFDEAEQLSGRALEAFREVGDRFGIVQALSPRIRALVALGRTMEAERGLEEALALSDSFGDLAFPAMAAAGTAVHLGFGERAVVIGELALERITAMGANSGEVRTTLALALCQVGRAEEALAMLLDLDISQPYPYAVRALAAALSRLTDDAVDDAESVLADPGATYLDRILADLAAASSEHRAGDTESAAERLTRARALAREAGDAVAVALTIRASLALVGEADGAHDDGAFALEPGWQRVVDGLAP